MEFSIIFQSEEFKSLRRIGGADTGQDRPDTRGTGQVLPDTRGTEQVLPDTRGTVNKYYQTLEALHKYYKSSTVRHANLQKVQAAFAEPLLMKEAKCHLWLLRGLPQTAPINVSLDSRSNSQTITGTYKQGTNASQAVGLAIECQTDSRDIIGVYTENKLC